MEADAGPSRLTPPDATQATAARGASRLSPGWLGSVATVLAVMTTGLGAVGYVAMRAHRHSQALTVADAAAVVAAKDCLAATQPSDVGALPAAQRKLDECSTGDFKSQITWYAAVLSEAYQAVNLHVRPPEIHAAVEAMDSDGSIIALIALRANISQEGMPERDNNYRIRVKMVPANGEFKIAHLDQVAQ